MEYTIFIPTHYLHPFTGKWRIINKEKRNFLLDSNYKKLVIDISLTDDKIIVIDKDDFGDIRYSTYKGELK